MRNSVLPVMTVLTIIAGAVGLQLGESAIGQIDPTYFQGALAPARDVTKDPRPVRAPGFAEASGWAEGQQALAEDCGDCLQGPTQAYARPAAPLFTYSDPTIEPRWQQAEASIEADELRMERSAESVQLQRYLHYPISADQAQIRTALGGDAADPGTEQEPAGL